MGSMAIGAKYKTTVKDPGTSGVLRMNEDKFSFTPNDPRSAMKLDVDFHGIKGWLCHPGSQGPVLHLKVGTATRKQASSVGWHCHPEAKKSPFLAGHKFNKVDGSRPAPPLLNLFKDSDKKLHRKFVLGNILQESEFWATRKNLLDDEANKETKQKPGFKSAMLADVRPSADGRTNKITFNLTAEIIHQVGSATRESQGPVLHLKVGTATRKQASSVGWHCHPEAKKSPFLAGHKFNKVDGSRPAPPLLNLFKDSDKKLHRKFVLGNILQESEFWATRKNLLDDEANKETKQKPGFKSAMLADVRPSADGRTNKITFNLTAEIIHQIRFL
ncbi:hypothetical protein PR202_gb29561 [Eleusine coracana subsp. coracana]|uniref:Uncharacterized protein n=1 Tax=Eleusine coracana subsp. coracana TaxID=191504 RepID=A0AAV5G0C1_ELECO|nr:hypothetical protein PR202_gb29561 [Eleusine coracana subsp. coracana]